MILRLHSATPAATVPSAAWPAVERIQHTTLPSYHLVTQPDHAHISGAIAANFDPALEPDLTPEIVRAIALHDHGWAQFEGYAPDCHVPPTDHAGRPLSFLDASPDTFLKAWSGSIHAASETSPAGEYIVSRHFQSLAERRLRAAIDPPETMERLHDFIVEEAVRELDLLPRTGLSEAQLDRLLKLLQFCDILSLVICSGAPGTLDFPDDFCIGALRFTPTPSGYQLTGITDPGIAPLTAPVHITIPVFEFRGTQFTPLPQLHLTLAS